MKVYWAALSVIVIVAGAFLLLGVHDEVSLGTKISALVCIAAPLAATWIYASNVKRHTAKAEIDSVDEKKPRFPATIFALSSAVMALYAIAPTRDVEGRYMNLLWVAIVVGVMLALITTGGSGRRRFAFWPKPFRVVCFAIMSVIFIISALFCVNFVFDMAEPNITEQTVIRATTIGRGTGRGVSYFVTVENNAGYTLRLQTTSIIYDYSAANVGGTIFLMEREGAFGIGSRRLILSDEIR